MKAKVPKLSVPAPNWVRNGWILGLGDGDTLRVVMDLGMGVRTETKARLLGLNAPEAGTPDGQAASAFVAAWVRTLPVDEKRHLPMVIIETIKDRVDKYGGRYDMTLYHPQTGESLGAALIAAGHAKPWDGKGVKP